MHHANILQHPPNPKLTYFGNNVPTNSLNGPFNFGPVVGRFREVLLCYFSRPIARVCVVGDQSAGIFNQKDLFLLINMNS